MNALSILLVTAAEAEKIVKPINTLISNVLPSLVGVVGSIAFLYCIVLGVKYAKADDPQEHEKAKKGLKNAIVGFVLIFVLMVILSISLPILKTWMMNQINIG